MEPKYVIKLVIFVVIVVIYLAFKAAKKQPEQVPRSRVPASRKPVGRSASSPAPPSPRRGRAAAAPAHKAAVESPVHLALQQWVTDPSFEFPEDVVLTTNQDALRVVNAMSRVPGNLACARAEQMLKLVGRITHMDALMACDEHVVPAMQALRQRTLPVNDSVINFSPFDLHMGKWLAAMGTPRAGIELVRLSREERWADHWMWSPIFDSIPTDGPGSLMLAQLLTQKLPAGFCAVALVDFCNTLARERDDVTEHPFDTREGWERLRQWLSDAEHPSYGHSAAAALPYIAPQALGQLLPLAIVHPDRRVQIYSAYAKVKTGDTSGLDVLVQACTEVEWSHMAVELLAELDQAERIPSHVRDPDFQVQTEFATWAMHPNEMKKVPDRMQVRYRKELYWPPQNERMEVILLAYEYDDLFGQVPSAGVALLGPITFALRAPDLQSMRNEDILGLYCEWELTSRHDERRPQSGDPEALFGRQVLASYNPDQGFLQADETLRPVYDFANGTPGSSFTDSQASRPGRLTVDDKLLRIWHNDLYEGEVTAEVQKLHGVSDPAKLRRSIEEHILYGDAQPAVVIHANPTIIAVKTDELDCAVLLWVSAAHVKYLGHSMDLSVGSRLISVNTYYFEDIGQKDLMPGAKSLGRYGGVWPMIGDFLCSDGEALQQMRSQIDESEWQHTHVLAQALIADRGWMVRSVRPLLSVVGGHRVDLDQLQGV